MEQSGVLIQAFGQQYTGGDLKVSFLGASGVVGVDKLSYDVSQAKENVYTMGSREPVGRIRKQKMYAGSMTVKAMLLDSMLKAAPNSDLLNIRPFTIGGNILNIDEGIIKNQQLLYVEITKVSAAYANDNNEIVHDLELAIGGAKITVV